MWLVQNSVGQNEGFLISKKVEYVIIPGLQEVNLYEVVTRVTEYIRCLSCVQKTLHWAYEIQ